MKRNIFIAINALSIGMLSFGGITTAFAATNTNQAISTLPQAINITKQEMLTDGTSLANKNQTKAIVDFGKKYNADLSKYTFESMPADPIQLNERDAFVTASKAVGLNGNTGRSTKIFVATIGVHDTGFTLPYYQQYIFTFTNDTLEGAAIRIAPSDGVTINLNEAQLLPFTALDTKTTANAEMIQSINTTIQYYGGILAKPANLKAALDFPSGIKADATVNKTLNTWFTKQGWKANNWTFYSNYVTLVDPADVSKGNVAYLGATDIQLAMLASSNNGTKAQVRMLLPDSGFYFTERSYKIKNTNNYFNIDFCASQIDATQPNSQPLFSWLIVKPLKENSAGKLDRFYYPANTSIKTITQDMNAYYNGKTPSKNTTVPK